MNEVKRREKQVFDIVFSTPREKIHEQRAKSFRYIDDYVKFLELDDEEILRQILLDKVPHYFNYILYCQVCGQGFAIDERFAFLRFSFCDYHCDVSIHLNCSKLEISRIDSG